MDKENKKGAKSRAIDCSYMCMSLLFFAALVLCSSFNSFASTHEISEVFIEASGSNKHEAKIKAHELGMQRALTLVADRLSIPTDGIKPIPYNELRSTFRPVVVINEVSLLEKYSATVTYSYERGRLYSLLLEYGDSKINDLFSEFLIIPVFKQRNTLNIWDKDKRWNDFWAESRNILNAHKLDYPQKTMYLANSITQENLSGLNYENFIEIFHNKLFKKVMIVTAEFFTNRHSGESLMEVKKYILSPYTAEPQVLKDDYDLATWDDIPYTVDLVIDRIIDDYGKLRENDVDADLDGDNLYAEEEQKPIIMNFDVFDKEELELVISKLEKVNQIDSFAVEHDYNTRYKILIYTTASEYELAEGLYINGLSYKIHGSLYNLIDIKKGG